MFYLLLVIGHGLAASYLLPITHKKGAGEEINSKFKIQNSQFTIQNFCLLFPNPLFGQCPIQKLSI